MAHPSKIEVYGGGKKEVENLAFPADERLLTQFYTTQSCLQLLASATPHS
jgi:hypothetical protein